MINTDKIVNYSWLLSSEFKEPNGESLKDVFNRVKPYYEKVIKIDIEEGLNILLSAHGNSLRALFIVLGLYAIENISSVEIPSGKPFVVEFKDNDISSSYYLE